MKASKNRSVYFQHAFQLSKHFTKIYQKNSINILTLKKLAGVGSTSLHKPNPSRTPTPSLPRSAQTDGLEILFVLCQVNHTYRKTIRLETLKYTCLTDHRFVGISASEADLFNDEATRKHDLIISWMKRELKLAAYLMPAG